MRHLLPRVVLSLPVAILTACGGLTPTQLSTFKLDQAAHTAATTQAAFLTASRQSECDSTELANTLAAENGKGSLDLGPCTPVGISDEDIQIRNALMGSIVLYSDKLQALASSASTQKLDQNSTTLAKNINTLASSKSISAYFGKQGFDKGIAAAVETAIIEITDAILEETISEDVKEFAAKNQTNLESVITALQYENTEFTGRALVQNITQSQFIVDSVFSSKSALKTPNFFWNVLQARQLLAAYYGLLKAGVPSVANDPSATLAPAPVASTANELSSASSPPKTTTAQICGIWTSTDSNGSEKGGLKSGSNTLPPTQVGAPTAPLAVGDNAWVDPAKPLNDVLDGFLAANKDIALGNPGGGDSAAEWADSCAQAATNTYNNLSK